jgi:hypothetical protein
MHLSALRRKLFVKLLYALLLPNQMLWLHIFIFYASRWPKKIRSWRKEGALRCRHGLVAGGFRPRQIWFPVAISVTDKSASQLLLICSLGVHMQRTL